MRAAIDSVLFMPAGDGREVPGGIRSSVAAPPSPGTGVALQNDEYNVVLHNATAPDEALLADQWLPNAPTTAAVDPAWMVTFLLAALRAPATTKALGTKGEPRAGM